jgi:cation:H+ antiporter
MVLIVLNFKIMVALKLIAGLILLVVGAEALVRGASKIAAVVGISPLVIGLTIVAFGTSSPELAVSIGSALDGQSDIALGNVVGSNIFNVLFILGVSALIVPLVVAQQLVRLDVPIMIGSSLLVLLFGFDGVLEKWEGAVMVAIGIWYTVFLIRQSKKEKTKQVLEDYQEEYADKGDPKNERLWLQITFIIVGLVLLVLGSSFLVDSAVAIAQSLGVSELVIGLTIVAAGTSLPEVATSVLASIRKQEDIAVGNVVGSNIFNILIILGLTAIIAPGGVPVNPAAMSLDIPFMIAVAVACLPLFFTGYRIDRWEGIVFLGYYVAYTAYLILKSQENASLEVFRNAMIWFVVPLTVLTLVVVTLREMKRKR